MARSVSRRTQKAWDRFGTWYGTRWTDQYGKHPPEDWCAVMDRLDDERLEDAMLAVRRETPIHPPTLGQFEAKIPAKQFDGGSRFNVPEILCEWAVFKLRHALCKHQLAKTWSYFGPVKEFVSKHAGDLLVSHPEIRGVFIPDCVECGKDTHRVLLTDVPSGFDPARKQGQFT